MHSFLRVDGKCRTQLCAEEHTSHTAPPPSSGWCEDASGQWESPVCMMMAEGDESLELVPSSKTPSLPYGNFSSNID